MTSLQKLFEHFLGVCARAALRREQSVVIAVAGSVGKSSTKEAIGIALGAKEEGSHVVMTKNSYNNALGVPLTIFGQEAPGRSPFAWLRILLVALWSRLGLLKLCASTFVLEMGADRQGDLAELLSIAKPQVGVLTAIGPEHTQFFGSLENVAHEEGTILQQLSAEDIAVVNADDRVAKSFTAGFAGNVYTFGTSEDATARVEDASMRIDAMSPESSGLDVILTLLGSVRTFRLTGTIGRPHAYAVAAALAVVNAIDGDERLAVQRLVESYHGMPGRMRLLEGIKRTWLIDDSYNSSPLAALSAIRDLAAFPVTEGCRRIAALGDMLELGSLAEEFHRDVGRAVAEAGIDEFIACGTFAHTVRESAIAFGMREENIFVFAKSEDAGRFIQDKLKEGDVVLVKGSQGARMERISLELMAHPERAEELLVRQTSDWFKKQ